MPGARLERRPHYLRPFHRGIGIKIPDEEVRLVGLGMGLNPMRPNGGSQNSSPCVEGGSFAFMRKFSASAHSSDTVDGPNSISPPSMNGRNW
jgi:hypothetical protein